MADVFSQEKRSEVMSHIRSHGNRDTEVALIKFFRRNKISGWRRHWPIFGKPDFVFPKFKLAVFVDGCFWHGCPKHVTWPKGNAEFWRNKISRNQIRDRQVTRKLKKNGWQVLRIWEHELAPKNENRLLLRISHFLSLT